MASSTRRKAVGRKGADEPTTEPDGSEAPEEDSTLDAALDRWSDITAREMAAYGIGATTSLLRGLQALQEAQLEAASEVRRMHEQAAAQLDSIHDVGDLARLQLSLAQSDGQVALASLSKIGALTSQQAVEAWNDATASWTKLNSSTWSAALQWFNGMARQPANAELVEAEVEHMVNPLTASPLVWPVQEVARQTMTLASSAWNDWLSWSGQLAQMGRSAQDRMSSQR